MNNMGTTKEKAESTSASKSLSRRGFSLPIYLIVVFAISWPFQFFIFFWTEAVWASKMLLISMIMVAVGTIIVGKYIFRDTFFDAGWRWGKPIHYFAAFSLPVLLWVVPTLLGLFFGIQIMPSDFKGINVLTMFIFSFFITLLPAFGEEFGWRGYLLPRLLIKHSIKKALLIQAFIWWTWHLPVLVFTGINAPLIEGNAFLSVTIILAISIIPSMMHAIVFSYFWTASGSLAVATVYHAAFDEIRDTIENSVGFGPLVELWQMLLLTIIGAILLWKGNWKRLKAIKEDIKKY